VSTTIRVYVLGLGANLLVGDQGVDGAVFRLDQKYWRRRQIRQDDLRWSAPASTMQKLVPPPPAGRIGGHRMSGRLPGTIGGGVRMNCGGKFGDIGAVSRACRLMSKDGASFERTRMTGLRIPQAPNIARDIILGATLELEEEDPGPSCAKDQGNLDVQAQHQPSQNTKKTAGAIFKNPRGLSAGALIDQAGP